MFISIIIDVYIGHSLKSLNDLENYNILSDTKMIFGMVYYILFIIFTLVVFYAFGMKIKEDSQLKRDRLTGLVAIKENTPSQEDQIVVKD